MREIKFRAKVIEKGMKHFWEYGGIIHITERYKDEEDFEECNIYQLINESGVGFDVDKETIGQYTGLEDKNGVEIYEGDILKIPEWLWEDEQEYCVCIYQQENEVCDVYGFGLYIKDGYSGKYKVRVPSDEWDEFEVVGNIYDNPELIEKEGK